MSTTRVYQQDGRYYFVEDLPERNPKTGRPRQKWHPLTRVDLGEAAMLEALAALKRQLVDKSLATGRGDMPARIREFILSPQLKRLTFRVRKEYERIYGVIAEAFADFDVREVRPADVLDFLDANFSDKLTARKHYKARMSTFFSWCVLKDYIAVNPCAEVRLASGPKRRGRMSWPVYWAMFDALPEVGRLFLEFTYLSRQRPTEPRLLRESGILPDRIHFEPTKTAKSSGEYVDIVRSARLNRIIERLRAIRADRLKGRKVVPLDEQRDPYLFVTEDGTPFTTSGLNSVWRRARLRAGHPKVTTKHIRPFALAQMEAAGHPVEKIREAAAHTTTEQTEGYLNQHRERYSTIVLATPRRPK